MENSHILSYFEILRGKLAKNKQKNSSGTEKVNRKKETNLMILTSVFNLCCGLKPVFIPSVVLKQ